MVARAVVGIPTVLCLWISEIIASVPGRCAVTVLELLTGTMLTGYGSISQAILAVPCRRHWTSYYWMVRKGKFDWKVMVHALCRIVKREFPSERCVVVGDDTLIPRVSEAAPGAAIQYDHARKPNRPDYILAQTVVSLSAVIGNSSGSWSVPLMSNLAVHTGNHGKLETMRAMVEEVSATLGAITLLLDAWYMKGYLISDVLTRDAIVIGQVRRDTALYDLPPLRTGKPGRPRKYGDRITKEKLNALPQTRTELPIYGGHRTVRYRTAVCMVRFLGGRLVRVVWVSMFVDGKWKAERLLLSTDWSHTAEDVIFTYSLRWTIEPMFAALKWSEGMIDMWMQSVETFHRWLNIVQIGRALIQMLAVKADAATTALAQVAAWRKEPYLTAGMVNRPSLLEYCAGRSVAPQRAEIRPFPMRSDEDQGGSDRQCRLIQPSRHQIQLLTARPAPAEPDQYVARLECLASQIYVYIRLLWSATGVTSSPFSKINGLARTVASLRAPILPIPGHHRRREADNPSSEPFPSRRSEGRSPPDPQRPELDRACSGTIW